MSFELAAKKRTVQGSGASRRLRRGNTVPAIVYGGSAAPAVIEIDHNAIYLSLRKEAFHSSVINLSIDGVVETVLLRDFQTHAYKPLILHVDFQRVDTEHKVHQKVPLHFVNEDLAPGVKLSGGTISHVITELDVACLPQDLPSFIEVDLQNLKAGESIHVSQLNLPAGVTAVVHGDDQTVVMINPKKGGEAAEEASA